MSKPLDTLKLLETFSRIAARGSISAAARDLNLSQASVSRQLKDLEEKFGIELVRRTTHSLTLTGAGMDLLNDARTLLDDWDAMLERHGDGADAIKGKLSVVAPIALGQMALADIAVRYQSENPDLVLDWQLEDQVIRFAERGCDCWIKVGPVPDDTLIVRPLAKVERMIVAAPELADNLAKPDMTSLETLPCVTLEPFFRDRVRLWQSTGEMAVFKPNERMNTNNVFSAHRAAKLGLGYTILPRWFVEEDLEAGRLVDILPTWRSESLTVHAAYLPARFQPRRLTLFLEHLYAGVSQIPGMEAIS